MRFIFTVSFFIFKKRNLLHKTLVNVVLMRIEYFSSPVLANNFSRHHDTIRLILCFKPIHKNVLCFQL